MLNEYILALALALGVFSIFGFLLAAYLVIAGS